MMFGSVLVLVAIATFGCSDERQTAATTAASATASADESDAVFILLFDRSISAQKQQYDSSQTAIRSCMDRAGFDYPFPPYDDPGIEQLEPGGIGDAADVASYGYHNAPLMELLEIRSAVAATSSGRDSLETYIASLDGGNRYAFYNALLGPPAADNRMTAATPEEPYAAAGAAGCTLDAARVTAAAALDLSRWPEEMARGFVELETLVDADPRVSAALVDWSACMRLSGYEVASRPEATELASAQIPVDGVRTVTASLADGTTVAVEIPAFNQGVLEATIEREIRIATADLECSQAAGYDELRGLAREELRRAFVDRWAPVIGELLAGA